MKLTHSYIRENVSSFMDLIIGNFRDNVNVKAIKR